MFRAVRRHPAFAWVVSVLAIGLMVSGTVRWFAVEVRQGGSFLVAPESAEDGFGRYVALYVRNGRSVTFSDTVQVLLHGEQTPGPLSPESSVQFAQGDEAPADMRVSLAAAWVAANDLIGVAVPYDSQLVVAEDQPETGSSAGLDRLGVSPGDPVRWRDGDLEVLAGGAVVSVEDPSVVALMESFTVPLGQPGLTVPDDVHGRSAGVVQGLAYVDLLTDGDLTGGLVVAGTGVLEPSGFLGPIGSPVFKAEAALEAGADVLFLPSSNYDSDIEMVRRRVGSRLEVVVVRSLSDAVRWLCERGGTARGAC